LDAAEPERLEDFLELVLDDCLVDLGWILNGSQLPEVVSVFMGT
jgi:hypothetical protein